MGTMSDYFRSFKEDEAKKTEGQTPSAPAVTVNEKSSSTKMSDYFRGLKEDSASGDSFRPAVSAFDVNNNNNGAINRNRPQDLLGPMRGSMENFETVKEKQTEIEELKRIPEYVKTGETDANGHPKAEYIGTQAANQKRNAISALEKEIEDIKNSESLERYERYAAGKTVKNSITKKYLTTIGNMNGGDPSILGYASFKGAFENGFISQVSARDMTETQRHTYDVLYEEDPYLADRYQKLIESDVRARTAEREIKQTKEAAKKYPVVGVAANVMGAVASPLAAVDNFVSMVKGEEYDPNSVWSAGARINQASAEGLTEDIENPVARGAANIGLGAVNFAAHIPLGPAALPMMAAEAAGQTSYSARMDGATTEESMALGLIAGIVEAATEKVPLENLFKAFDGVGKAAAKEATAKAVRNAILSQMAKGAFEEGMEETISEYANTIADNIIRGDNSEMMKYRDSLMNEGHLTEKEANKKAFMQYYVWNPLASGAGGAILGGTFRGGATAWGNRWVIANNAINKKPKSQTVPVTTPTPAANGGNIPRVPTSSVDSAEAAKDFSRYAQSVFESVDNDTYEPELMSDPEIADAVSDMDVGEGNTFTPSDGVIQARDVHEDFRNTGKFIPDTPTQEFRKAEAAKAKNDIQRSGILAGASKADIRMAEVMSALTGRNVIFESEDYRINGHFDGNNTIFVNASRKDGIFAQVLAHELTHSVEKTKAYKGLVKAARSFVEANTFTDDNGVTHDWNYYFTEAHAEQDVMYPKLTGQAFTDEKADAEVVAKVLEGFFADNTADAARNQVALDTWLAETVKTNRNAVTRMWYKLSQMAKRLRSDINDRRARKADGYDAEARERELMLRRIEDIRDRFGRALMEAKKQGAKSGNAAFKIAAENNDKSSIKKQIMANLDILNSMKSVVDIKYAPMEKGALRRKAVEEFKKIGFKVDRQNFGIIEIGDSQVRKGITYINNEGEMAALLTVPAVLKRGIQINDRNNHKDRMYDTITIAAPVTVNGTRGIVGVTVKLDNKKNRYRAHRILMPDGSEFVFDFTNEKAEPTTDMSLSVNDKNTRISSASNNSISHSESKVNTSGESFSYTPDSDYIGTMPINDAEAANRKRALEMYRQLEAGKDIGNGNMDPAEYIYMQTGWAYNNLGNFVVDHEAPIYLDNRTQHQMANRRADHTEGVNNALRSENAGLREGLERAVSVARDAYGMKSSDYTSTTKAARDIIGRITDMFGGGYTKKQANGFIKKLLSIYDKRSEVDSYGVRAVPDEQISSELGALVAEMQDIGIEDDERRELQKRLKAELKVPVYLSEKARGDFSGGYGKMAKDYRGRVNFTTKDRGVPVDVRYEELTGIFPDMFPADITSEADQAEKILEIADMIRDEEFATESRYMFSGGEAQSRADAVDAARVIFEGFRQMDAMPKTEADRYAREAEKARRAADEVRKNSAEQIARETERIRAEERRRADEETEWIKFYEDRDNARMAAEYREGLQRAEERVDQVAENYRQATDEMANEYREALDKQAEDAAKAYQKERIKRTFNRIKKLYDNPTKNHNIKESERDFVKSALDLMESIFASGVTPRTMVNLDYSYATETEQKNLDHLRGLYDRLSDLEAKTKDQKVIAPDTSAVMDDLKEEIHRYETRLSELFTRKRNELQGMTVTRLMSDFAAEYGKLRDAEEGYISDAYDPAVHERISNMASNRELSGKTVRKLTSSELESIYEVFASAVNVVYRTNNMFNDRKGATLMENVTDTITELNDVNASRPTGKINRFIDKHFKWANFKPVYAMRYLGSKTMSRLYDNLRKGEDVYAKDIDEARMFYEGEVEKYNADNWDLKEKHTFSTESGQRFELTLDQMMSVYAYSKRDQAALHFSDGGIIPKSKTDKIWGKAKHKAEKASPGNIDAVINSIVGDATAYKLTGKALDTVIDSLTAEQKKFVDDLQNYMSNELSAKGNEVSRAMYGIDLFKEKFYMPLKSATQYMKVRYEEGKGDVRIKNKGMTKETVSGANNPVVVEGFTDVWANHVNEMSLYHAMVLPMEDFSKVFGYAGGITEQRADANVKHDNISVRAVIENLYGENATKYIDKLIRDINGGIKADTEGALDAMISKSKKASVLASLSVVIQQPTAGIRAMAYIDPKYFVGKKAGKPSEKSWEECKKYAPVAVIKEMGRFDTGTGVNASKYITDNKSVLELADDLAGWGASKADEVTWSSIWEACKREAADKNKALKTNDAICRAAAQRFTEVVSLTQVYDSVFSRSETMRSKNQLHQMATSFMSEPVTVANMVYDAFVQAKRGDKQILGRVVSAVVVSTLVNNALKSIIYAMRDDDDDETYLEKYLGSLVSNTLDSMNPLTYVPYVRDVWSLFQGYDVERMDVALIQNLVDAIVYAAGPKGSTLEKIERLAGVAGDMFGIPVKNLLRELRGIYNGVTTLAADISGKTPTTLHGVTNAVTDSLLDPVYRMPYVGNLIDKESKTDKLYDAILKDKSHAERMRGTYKDDVAYESALKTALKENDPRVQQAADARYAGDIDVYDDIVNEIVADGKFDKRIVVGAVNSAYNAMNKTDTARTPDEKAVSIYTSEMVGEAFKLGDEETALKAVEDLIGVKMENGADEKKARSSVKTSVTKVMKPLYLEAYKNGDDKEMARVKQFLEDTGLYGNSAKSSLDGWEKEYNSEHGKPETQTKANGSQYKFNIPEVKVPEVKVPKVEVPKFNFNFK